jgi:hypothetical protein
VGSLAPHAYSAASSYQSLFTLFFLGINIQEDKTPEIKSYLDLRPFRGESYYYNTAIW